MREDTDTVKAAVITLHNVCNYGSQLQAYATQEKLKQYFDEVVFIDYRRPDTYGAALMRTFSKGNVLKALAVFPTLLYWKRLFEGFWKTHLRMSGETYLKERDFERFSDCADVYFTGSDQVWNTGWNGGVLPPYYLSFAPEDKPKFSYAASFGKNRFSEKEIELSEKYIKRFRRISVREESGIQVLGAQYGYKGAVRLLDPTLAMPPSFWRSAAPKAKVKGDYILIYNLKRSGDFDAYAKELSRRTGLPLYRFCTRIDQIFRNGKSLVMPEIFEFITLIDNAKIVLTDSFHATAFSMNLETDPVCIYPGDYSGRIAELLALLKSEHRHVKDESDFDVVNRPVDWHMVRGILKEERGRTDQFLSEIMEIVKLRREVEK